MVVFNAQMSSTAGRQGWPQQGIPQVDGVHDDLGIEHVTIVSIVMLRVVFNAQMSSTTGRQWGGGLNKEYRR